MINPNGFSESFLPWILYIAIPVAILILGMFSFYRASTVKRSLVGGLVAFFGSVELLFLLSLIRSSMQMSQYVPMGLVASTVIAVGTIAVGIVGLYKPKKSV